MADPIKTAATFRKELRATFIAEATIFGSLLGMGVTALYFALES